MEGPRRIQFTVYGEARPQGSKISQVIYRRDGTPVTKNGRVVTVVRDDCPKTRHWRETIAAAARAAYSGPLLTGALKISLGFFRPRPRGHFGKRGLRASAAKFPTTRPDTVKLTLAVEDALSGVLWRDDAQIVEHHIVKSWGEPARVDVLVEVLEVENAAEAAGG